MMMHGFNHSTQEAMKSGFFVSFESMATQRNPVMKKQKQINKQIKTTKKLLSQCPPDPVLAKST